MKSRNKSLKTPRITARAGYRQLLMAGLCLLLFVAKGISAAPQVAASIKPLQLIAEAITEGVSTPELILSNSQDPHNAALRPSDRLTLAQADIVLWVGPMLELPLVGPISAMGSKNLAVQNMPDIILHEVAGNPDPHVWLDTRNARQIGINLEQALQQLDPANGQLYAKNLQSFATALDKLDSSITQELAPLQPRPWSVYHNAFRYFTRQFALTEPLAPTESPNNQPGIRSIVVLRDDIEQKKITCMLTEPTMNHAELQTLLGNANLRIVTADVMGLSLEPTAAAYPALIQNFSHSLADCLRDSPSSYK
jgi:zinc transport system substrate-binding protein